MVSETAYKSSKIRPILTQPCSYLAVGVAGMVGTCNLGGRIPLAVGSLPPVLAVARGGHIHLGSDVLGALGGPVGSPRAIIEGIDFGALGA